MDKEREGRERVSETKKWSERMWLRCEKCAGNNAPIYADSVQQRGEIRVQQRGEIRGHDAMAKKREECMERKGKKCRTVPAGGKSTRWKETGQGAPHHRPPPRDREREGRGMGE